MGLYSENKDAYTTDLGVEISRTATGVIITVDGEIVSENEFVYILYSRSGSEIYFNGTYSEVTNIEIKEITDFAAPYIQAEHVFIDASVNDRVKVLMPNGEFMKETATIIKINEKESSPDKGFLTFEVRFDDGKVLSVGKHEIDLANNCFYKDGK